MATKAKIEKVFKLKQIKGALNVIDLVKPY